MLRVERIYDILQSKGVDFYTGVPDSLLKDICAYITDNTPKEKNIITANEGVAVGLAVGYNMASGKIPLVYMQNSGLGNAVNPLLSLADEKVYCIPLLLMIGWRGEPGTKDEPQHKKQGEVTLDLLDAMKIPFKILDLEEDCAIQQICEVILSAKTKSSPHAIVIRKDTFGKYKLQIKEKNDYPLSREEALKLVVDCLGEKEVVVSTTGKLSRELFEYREAKLQGHEKDFLTVGSMGHSSSIALGIALEKKDRQVFCLDGDGAFLMHMGALTNIGELKPNNFKHIIFNNGAHESVGAQPTSAFQVDIPSIAQACGYKYANTVSQMDEISSELKHLLEIEGPAMLEIKVRIESRDDLGRPTTTPIENKEAFIRFLSSK